MNKKWKLIEKIVNGTKTIESRWYKNKIAPWNRIKKGEQVYFKNSGDVIIAKAIVKKVIQISNLNQEKFEEIVTLYGQQIRLLYTQYNEYYQKKNYVLLIFLEQPQLLSSPFSINKSGFGVGSAWLCIEDINRIKIL